jgi:hypothetical protein
MRMRGSVRGIPRGIREVSRVADKKITPKAAEAKSTKEADSDKAATRVTKHRSMSRRAKSRRRT